VKYGVNMKEIWEIRKYRRNMGKYRRNMEEIRGNMEEI
jgi:hypothetical protein